MKLISALLLILLSVQVAIGQNLVRNGGFENAEKIPRDLGHFNATDWYSVNKGSTPDLFSAHAPQNTIANPASYYVSVAPFKDSAFAGIVVAVPENGYREYIATTLTSPLIKDSTYVFEISVAIPKLSRYTIPSLDIVFSKKRITGGNAYTIINQQPSLTLNTRAVKTDGTWTSFSVYYIAQGGEKYLTISNFASEKATKLTQIKGRKKGVYQTIYDNAYVCVDEVKLQALYPPKLIEPTSCAPENDFIPDSVDIEPTTHLELSVPKIAAELHKCYVVEGIRFKTASAEIESTQIPALDNIVTILVDNPDFKIEITGHTDNTGNEASNQALSKNRATSVKTYLISKGIDAYRISVVGKGSTQPAADNETDSGKAMNRRIEVIFKP